MAGRPVGDSTMNKRIDTFFALVAKSDKVTELAEAQIVDTKNRIEAEEKRRDAKNKLYKSLNLAPEAVEALMAAEGLNADNSADLGRIEATERVTKALAALRKDFGTLKHILGSEAGKDLVNSVF